MTIIIITLLHIQQSVWLPGDVSVPVSVPLFLGRGGGVWWKAAVERNQRKMLFTLIGLDSDSGYLSGTLDHMCERVWDDVSQSGGVKESR